MGEKKSHQGEIQNKTNNIRLRLNTVTVYSLRRYHPYIKE